MTTPDRNHVCYECGGRMYAYPQERVTCPHNGVKYNATTRQCGTCKAFETEYAPSCDAAIFEDWYVPPPEREDDEGP